MPTALRSIRLYCIDCCVGSYAEVRECSAESCPCWPYRHGHNPKKCKSGPTSTYVVDEKMYAKKAVFARCLDCSQRRNSNCHQRECALYDVRHPQNPKIRSKTRSVGPLRRVAG